MNIEPRPPRTFNRRAIAERMPTGYSTSPNRETRYITKNGYWMVIDTNEFSNNFGWPQLEHIVVVEKMFGQNLPLKAVVHHLNGNRLDNCPCNLIYCEDHKAHMRMHRTQKAYEACGHFDWVQCRVCKGWSEPRVMWEKGNGHIHPHCRYVKNKYKMGNLLGLEC